MELSDFIERTLVDITKAVAGAGAKVGDLGGAVNPAVRSLPAGTLHVSTRAGLVKVLAVDFDVAVTAANSQEAGARAGIQVLGVALGMAVDARTDHHSSTVSRIKFSVPVALPTRLPEEQ